MRSGVWVALGSVGVGSLSFVKTIVLARLLTPESFGLMALCAMVLRGIQVLTETGLTSALIQRPTDVEEAKLSVYSLTAIRGAILGVIVVLASPFFASLYDQPLLAPLLQTLAIILVVGGFQNVNAVVLQKELSFKLLTRIQLVLAVLDAAIVTLLAYVWRDVWALVVGQVVTAVVAVLLSFAMLPGWPRFGWNAKLIKELFLYGRFVTGLAIVLFLTTEIDNAVIGKILGVEALGIYALAYMLANLPATHLAKVLARVMFPAYSKLQSDRSSLNDAYLLTVRVIAILVVPASIGLAVIGDEIVRIVYGAQWLPPSFVIAVLCAFGAFRAIGSINGYVLNAIGRPDIVFYTNLTKLIVIGIVIVPASKAYGLLGAACAVTVPLVLMFLIETFLFSRTLSLPVARIWGAVEPAISSSMVVGIAVLVVKLWTPIDTTTRLLGIVVGAALLYVALNWKRLLETREVIAGYRANGR